MVSFRLMRTCSAGVVPWSLFVFFIVLLLRLMPTYSWIVILLRICGIVWRINCIVFLIYLLWGRYWIVFLQARDVFSAAIIHTVHAIWKTRNTLCFSSDRVSLHATKSTIISLVALSGNMFYGQCLRSDKLLLDNFHV